MHKQSFFKFVLFLGLLILSGSFAASGLSAQTADRENLTYYLNQLKAKHKEIISYSPAVTDKVRPRKHSLSGTLEESLKELLHGTNLKFRKRSGYYYLYVEKTRPLRIHAPQLIQRSSPALPRLPRIEPEYPQPPRFAVKTNLLYDAAATINIGFEFAVARQWTIDVSGNYNGWSIGGHQWKHFMLQPELRYWTGKRFCGHYIGAHLHAGTFNMGNLPSWGGIVSGNMQSHRYRGHFYGAGLSYGYHIELTRRWHLEPSLGIGYARIPYDKYSPHEHETKLKEDARNYFGVTKAAVSLIYIMK